jgi:hypothetical protein
MTAKIDYDAYRGTADGSLRLATLPGAGLPAHVKRKDRILMPKGKSPLHQTSIATWPLKDIAFSNSLPIDVLLRSFSPTGRRRSPRQFIGPQINDDRSQT